MWTGRQTLESIEGALTTLRREEGQLEAALRSAVSDAERLRKERLETLRELARVKLDEMAAGRLANNLDAGERRAAHLLEDYRLRIAALEDRREALLTEIAQAEAQRKTAAEVMEQALAAVEQTRGQAHAQIKVTPPWQTAKAAGDAADAVAAEAEKKAANSEAEQALKRKPYDDDPLFTYLWERKFGTSTYAAGNLTRTVDRMVADFIGFLDARPNYAALIEIPLRLREHATAKRAAATEVGTALAEIERRAMAAAGIEAKERALAEARHKHATADRTVEDKQGLMRKVDEEHNTLVAGGKDAAYREALETIAVADSKDDVAALYLEARRTPGGADDAIVRSIETIDTRVGRTDGELANLRQTARDLAKRRADVEQSRDRFRKAGYDHPNATFGNNGDIAEMLKSVLAGGAGGLLWDLLRSGYSYRQPRSPPDFGGPTFPFPQPRSGHSDPGERWREPSSRGTWSWDGGGGGGGGGSWSGGGSSDDQFTTDETI
jgi:hypothetical protein